LGFLNPLRRFNIKSIILNNILESIPVGLLIINPDGVIITSNQAASHILGYSCRMFEGKGWGDLFLEEPRNYAFNQVILDVIQEKKVNLHRRVSYIQPSGKRLQLSITGSFLKEDEQIAGIVLILHDVTELQRLHDREKRVLREKHRLERERAEGLMRLAMAISHQIRNPIMSIGGFAKRTLGKIDEHASIVPYLNNILCDAERLETIVKIVNDYTRITRAEPVKISLSDMIEEEVFRFQSEKAALSKRVDWSLDFPTVAFAVDPALFRRALYEVLLNALEFLHGDEGAVRINLAKERDSLLLEIADNGAGILEDDLPYVFDPFFTTKAVGVGMGLCLVRRIAGAHGGDVRIDSKPGQGAKVSMRFPDPTQVG
jgi:PAS domain S-box-containing protein